MQIKFGLTKLNSLTPPPQVLATESSLRHPHATEENVSVPFHNFPPFIPVQTSWVIPPFENRGTCDSILSRFLDSHMQIC